MNLRMRIPTRHRVCNYVTFQERPNLARSVRPYSPACKLPVCLLHYVIAKKGVGHAIDGEEGRTVCRGIVQG